MSTAATSAYAVAQVFRRHGISIAIGAPIMQIQEIAMAINLMGRHQVIITYEINVSVPGGHALSVMHKSANQRWTKAAQHLFVALPNAGSSKDQRSECIQKLGEVAEQLTALLQEGPAS